jgi:hypothetical protein
LLGRGIVVLHQLTDLLLKSHLVQQVVSPLLDRWISQLDIRRGLCPHYGQRNQRENGSRKTTPPASNGSRNGKEAKQIHEYPQQVVVGTFEVSPLRNRLRSGISSTLKK